MHLIIPRSLSLPCLSDFFSLFFYFSCLFSLQVCRGFVRTLKWWLVSSQTDSGDSAGPLWLQPFWRYILFFCSVHSLTHIHRHTDKCSLKQFHFQCCCLSCSSICFWKEVRGRNCSCNAEMENYSFLLLPVMSPSLKFAFHKKTPITVIDNSQCRHTCTFICWVCFLQNGH